MLGKSAILVTRGNKRLRGICRNGMDPTTEMNKKGTKSLKPLESNHWWFERRIIIELKYARWISCIDFLKNGWDLKSLVEIQFQQKNLPKPKSTPVRSPSWFLGKKAIRQVSRKSCFHLPGSRYTYLEPNWPLLEEATCYFIGQILQNIWVI